MSRRLTKKSLVSVPFREVSTPRSEPSWFAPSTRRPPTSTVISGAVSVSRLALSTSRCSAGFCAPLPGVVAEPVGGRLEHGEGLDVGLVLRRVRAPRGEGHLDVEAGVPRGLLDGGAAAQHDQVGERDPRAARGLRRELLLDRLQPGQDLRQPRGTVDGPLVLRREADPGAVGAPALVGAAERRRRGPGGGDELRHRQPGSEDPLLEGRDLLRAHQRVRDRRHGVLP